MGDIKFAFCQSVCSEHISSEPAEQIWLKFCRDGGLSQMLHFGGIASGVLPAELTIYHHGDIVSALHWMTCFLPQWSLVICFLDYLFSCFLITLSPAAY